MKPPERSFDHNLVAKQKEPIISSINESSAIKGKECDTKLLFPEMKERKPNGKKKEGRKGGRGEEGRGEERRSHPSCRTVWKEKAAPRRGGGWLGLVPGGKKG